MSEATLLDVPLTGAYAERPVLKQNKFDLLLHRLASAVPENSVLSKGEEVVREAATLSEYWRNASEGEIRRHLADLSKDKAILDSTAQTGKLFAILREVARRTLRKPYFDVQLLGAWVMLRGHIAEMQTGEGKTLTASLAAASAALAGLPVHIVSVNDYLVERDAEQLRPFYSWLDLSVGTIVEGMDLPARRAAYGSNICYCSNKELVFDYLKDRITLSGKNSPIALQLGRVYREDNSLSQLLLRGLHFAIVDEADGVMIDEARVPVIISRSRSDNERGEFYYHAITLAKSLEADHYRIYPEQRLVKLTDEGRLALIGKGNDLGGLWKRVQWREEAVIQALNALNLYHRDEHYLVSEDKVLIIDEFTGRTMAERSWENGLHQMVEAKEGVTVTGEREAIAKISYQRFFRRYLHLSGMTGTAEEVRGELRDIYRTEVHRIPTNRPSRRNHLDSRYFFTSEEKWEAVAARVQQLHEGGQPVLVGTRSVADSELMSERLNALGLAHEVLNARQNAEEAAIVALAGHPNRITVATNMAGRGTDIAVPEAAITSGGLHVIATELHEAARIDRQLFGRSARQGDPGSCELYASLSDSLVNQYAGPLTKLLIALFGKKYPQIVGNLALKRLQRRVEMQHSNIRRQLLESDEQLESMLAFAGRKQ